jgi:membrane protein implicated in regulation of membrane protease activity
LKILLQLLGVIAIVILLASVIAALFVLLSYGLGLLLTVVLPFSRFEATLLAMLALTAVGAVIWSFWRTPIEEMSPIPENADEEYEQRNEAELTTPARRPAHRIHMLPTTLTQSQRLATSVRLNAPCPCGSGKKYKHCHGRRVQT